MIIDKEKAQLDGASGGAVNENDSVSNIDIHQLAQGVPLFPKTKCGVDFIHCPTDLEMPNEKVAHLIHTLYAKSIPYWDHSRWTVLHTDYLRNRYGGQYRQIIRTALENQLIEEREDKKYSAGNYSKSYRLHPRLWETTWTTADIQAKRFRTTLERVKREIHQKITTPVDRHLFGMLGEVTIDPSISAILPYLHSNYELPALHAIASQDWDYLAGDLFGRRRHHNISRLFCLVRYYLRVRQQTLWDLDIPNSQPLFVGIIARDFYLKIRKKKKYRNIQEKTGTKEQRDKERDKRKYMLHNQSLDHSDRNDGFWTPLPPDLENYLKLCEDGTLYETFAKLANMTTNREKIKKYVITMLHDSNYQHWNNRYWRVMVDHFPTVADCMLTLKSYPTLISGRDPKDGKIKPHRDFSCIVQRAESTFMFNEVVPLLMSRYPSAWYVTIHDSFLTLKEFVEPIQATMLEAFERLGVRPTKLKSKDCSNLDTYRGKLADYLTDNHSLKERLQCRLLAIKKNPRLTDKYENQ